MNDRKFVNITLCMLLVYLGKPADSTDCSAFFAIRPVSATVKENEEAVYTCTVSNFTRNMYLGWIMDPKNQTFSISKSDNSLKERISTLTITGIKHIRQTQHCSLVIKDDINSPIQCKSKSATLNVQYFPDDDEIACGPKILEDFHIGDKLQAWCSSFEGNPIVQMQWQTDAHGLALTTSFQEGAQILLEQEFTIAPYLHGKTLKCIVSSPQVFPGKVHSCNVGTFSVIYKPNISINPRELHVTDNNTGNYLVGCSGDAFPAIQSYSWMCSPANVLSGCDSDTATLYLTLNTTVLEFYQEPIINISVVCFVSNSEGTSNATSHVYVMKSDSHDKVPNDDDLKMVDIELCLVEVTNNTMDNTWQLHWKCSLYTKHNGFAKFEIQWSLDGVPIHENNKTFLNQTSIYSSSVTLSRAIALEDMGKPLECKVFNNATSLSVIMAISLNRSVCVSTSDTDPANEYVTLSTPLTALKTLNNQSGFSCLPTSYVTATTSTFPHTKTNQFINVNGKEENESNWILSRKGIIALLVGGGIILALSLLAQVLVLIHNKVNFNKNLRNIQQLQSSAPYLLTCQHTSTIGSICSLPIGTENDSGAFHLSSIKSSGSQPVSSTDDQRITRCSTMSEESVSSLSVSSLSSVGLNEMV